MQEMGESVRRLACRASGSTAALEKSQADCLLYRNALLQRYRAEFKPNFDEAVGFAHLDDKPTVSELIAELEGTPGK
jgi:hypothetical protein